MESIKNNKGYSSVSDKFISALDGDSRIILSDKFLDKKLIAVFKDEELINSAQAFFANNLNISETSRNTFMHRNTLIYRIEKIEKLTGLNIRNLNDAFSFMFLKSIYDKTKIVR